MLTSNKLNKRIFSILIVIAFCISVYGIVAPIEDNQTSSTIKKVPKIPEPDNVIRQSIAVASVPIVIDGDSHLIALNFPGSGTAVDPYRIEGLQFSSSNSALISIYGTTLHFVIQDNSFDGQGSLHEAIYLDNVMNGEIRKNNFSNIGYGVYLQYSSYIIVTENSFNDLIFGITGYGVYLESSSNIKVIDNNFDNLVAGVSILQDSHNNLVDNNQFYDMSYYGIWVSGDIGGQFPSYNILNRNNINSSFRGISHHLGDYDEILNNNIEGATDGIFIDSWTSASLISGNKIHDNQNGIIFSSTPSGPEGNTISNNVISDNTKNGIRVDAGIENLFERNIILNNGEYGFFSNSSEFRYNSMIRNDFVGNNLGSTQAYEGNITNNYSYNFWADHDNTDNIAPFGTADSPYNLDGDGLDQDPYPKTTPYNIIHRFTGALLTYPVGGETLQGSVDVTWTPGSDSFGYDIFYTLELVDSDSTTVIVSGLTGSAYLWDTADFGNGETYKIRIITENTRGNYKEDISNDFFTIDNIIGTQITIDGNDDFANLGFPGNGSADNPYLIENLVISESSSILLDIRNTDVHFVVRHNQFNGEYSSFDAIYLQNVVNGVFRNNTIMNANIGVHIVQSSYITLDSNRIYYNSAEGVVASDSDYLVITNNNISYNGDDGIFFENTHFSLVSGNEIFRNGYNFPLGDGVRLSISGLNLAFGGGIFLDPSTHNVIESNSIYENGQDGIILLESNYTTIRSNEVTNNGKNGLAVLNSSHGVFTDNTFSYNGFGVGRDLASSSSEYARLSTLGSNSLNLAFGGGIFLDPGFDNVVSGNTVTGNSEHGVYLFVTDTTSVSGNTITNNGFTGVFVQNSTRFDIIGNTIGGNGRNNQGFASATGLASVSGLNLAFGGGIYLDPSNTGTISGNTVFDNAFSGIHLLDTNGINITDNGVSGNGLYGLFLNSSSSNRIVNNNITENGVVVSSRLKVVGLASVSGLNLAFGGGIYLDPSENNYVSGNKVNNNAQTGIHLLLSNNSQIVGNEVSGNGETGVFVENSNGNTISHNTITSNGINAGLASASGLNLAFGGGIYLDPSSDNTVEGNTVSDNGVTGIYMLEIDNSRILGNTISNNGETGVFVENSNGNTISGNTITGNGKEVGLASKSGLNLAFGGGIYLDPSSDNTIVGNTVSDNGVTGIYMLEINNSRILGNTISNNGETGLFIQNSSENLIQGNEITKSGTNTGLASASSLNAFLGAGIYLDPSSHNTIIENILKDNLGYGLFIDLFSSFTTTSNNDFINNNVGGGSQAYDDGKDNSFTGNYWSDLVDPTKPYIIDGGAGSTDPTPASEPNVYKSPITSDPVLLYPNGGENIKGVITVEWEQVETSSPDIEVSYSLYLSSSLGRKWSFHKISWSLIVNGLVDQSSYEWDTSDYNGKYLLKVVASVEGDPFPREDVSDDTFRLDNVIRPTKTTTTPSLTLIGILGAFALFILKRKKIK